MKLGMVTYLMGKDMDCPQLIAFCHEVGLAGVELRTTHAHGVEPELGAERRAEIRKMFDDSPVAIAGLGSACEFHSADPAELRANVELTKAFVRLAADVGAPGVKVRPNKLVENVSPEATCEQIGKAFSEVAAFGADYGVEIRMECHGSGTSDPRAMRLIMDAADHPNAKVNWNSNSVDMDANGSIAWSFDLLKDRITHVHLRDLGINDYPWRDLFSRLKAIDFQGYCCAEIQYNPEPERFMKYYKALFDLLTGAYRFPQAGQV